jgi:hypothetical protein
MLLLLLLLLLLQFSRNQSTNQSITPYNFHDHAVHMLIAMDASRNIGQSWLHALFPLIAHIRTQLPSHLSLCQHCVLPAETLAPNSLAHGP